MEIKKISKKKSIIFTIIKGAYPVLIGIVATWVFTQGAYLIGHLFFKQEGLIACIYGLIALLLLCFGVSILIFGIFGCIAGVTYCIEYCKMCSRFARLPSTQQEFDEVTKDFDVNDCLDFFLDMVSFDYAFGKRHFYRYTHYTDYECNEMIECGKMMLAKYGEMDTSFLESLGCDTRCMLEEYMNIQN